MNIVARTLLMTIFFALGCLLPPAILYLLAVLSYPQYYFMQYPSLINPINFFIRVGYPKELAIIFPSLALGAFLSYRVYSMITHKHLP